MKLGGFKTYNVHFQCNHMATLKIVGDKKCHCLCHNVALTIKMTKGDLGFFFSAFFFLHVLI